MEDARSNPGIRFWKIGAAVVALVFTLGALLVWQVDLLHLHFSYSDVKKEYLASGMPWTSEDLYSGITPEQARDRTELVDAAKSILEDYGVPATILWKPEPKPTSVGGPPAAID